MKIYATGEAQQLQPPHGLLAERKSGRVVGVGDLGANNSDNDFGWTGVKAVINVEGVNYVLDFPEEVRIETDDGVEFVSTDAGRPNGWYPTLEDRAQYGLYLFDLKN